MIVSGTTINTANIGTFPALTPGGACLIANLQPGVLNFQIDGTYVGQLHVGGSLSGLSGQQYADNSITSLSGAVGAISANGTGIFSVNTVGGSVYIYASAFSSGSCIITPLSSSVNTNNPGTTPGSFTVSGVSTAANQISQLAISQNYSYKYDDSGIGNNYLYIGMCAPGNIPNISSAVWTIQQINYDSNNIVTSQPWAGMSSAGIPLLNQIWSNRASLSYS
jgi:hypothetical protein